MIKKGKILTGQRRGKRSNKNRKESIQIIQLTGKSHILGGVQVGRGGSTKGAHRSNPRVVRPVQQESQERGNVA